MSELINVAANSRNKRCELLAGTSALVLLAAFELINPALASEDGAPVVWLELGGQLEHMNITQDRFDAPFENGPGPLEPKPAPWTSWPPFSYHAAPAPTAPFDPSHPFDLQKPPRYSISGEGKLIFAPHGTDWVFSAAVRYGRATGHRSDIQKTQRNKFLQNTNAPGVYVTPRVARFTNGDIDYSQSHMVLDFQAGKDVGLGVFGNSHSTINAGVRIAQFSSRSSVTILGNLGLQPYRYTKYAYYGPPNKNVQYKTRFQSYGLRAHSTRNFHGIGPSLSWDGSAAVAGHADGMQLMFDWGINGALLFGRQRAATDHKTASYDRYQLYGYKVALRYTQYKFATAHTRSHSVVIPNVGGFAGLSFKFPNAKISFGYRADVFFGAMDAGIDARSTEDMAFHGPFAKVSIGLGG